MKLQVRFDAYRMSAQSEIEDAWRAARDEREKCIRALEAHAKRIEGKAGGWRDWPDMGMLAKADTLRWAVRLLRELK